MLNGVHHPAPGAAEEARCRTPSPLRMARCPAHADDKASLGIKEAGDGRVLVHCHAGCSQDAVITPARRGLWRTGQRRTATRNQG